jgi:hypothetical protein
MYRSRNSKYFTSELAAQPSGDERAGSLSRLYYQDSQGKRRYDAVPAWKMTGFWAKAWR